MGSDVRQITTVLSARNLASGVVDTFGKSLAGVATAAENAGRRVGQGFENATNSLQNALGNLTENLLTGQDLGGALLTFGAYLGGQMAEGLFVQMAEKLAGSSIVAAIGPALASAGSAIGGAMAAAIPIGMAALPALLVAALVAAVAFLVTHPEVAAKIAEVAGGIVHGIVGGLGALAGGLLDVVGKAFGAVVQLTIDVVGTIVGFWLGIPGKLFDLGVSIVRTIVGGLVSLPGKVADVVRQAFANLKIDVGPFHISAAGIRIDLPNITQDPKFAGLTYAQAHGLAPLPGHAAGGWVGLHGPELGWLGENGPEYVRRAGTGTGDGDSGPTIHRIYLDGRQIAEVVDEHQGEMLRRAPAAASY